MKKNGTIGKGVVIASLRKQGLQVKRVTNDDGERVWAVSDGSEYPDLQTIAEVYKINGKVKHD